MCNCASTHDIVPLKENYIIIQYLLENDLVAVFTVL